MAEKGKGDFPKHVHYKDNLDLDVGPYKNKPSYVKNKKERSSDA